jgi:hypothetical protein
MFWLSGLLAVKGLQVLKTMRANVTELGPPTVCSDPNLHEKVNEDTNNTLNMGWRVIGPKTSAQL